MGKAKGKIVNWNAYNQALINRGSLTFWVDDNVIASWYSNKHNEGQGKNPYYSDMTIETALMIKGIFGQNPKKLICVIIQFLVSDHGCNRCIMSLLFTY